MKRDRETQAVGGSHFPYTAGNLLNKNIYYGKGELLFAGSGGWLVVSGASRQQEQEKGRGKPVTVLVLRRIGLVLCNDIRYF